VATPTAEPVAVEKPRRGFWTFAFGFIVGVIALFGLALFATLRNL
jgi:LPS O-antigen subunit length determinant protein (WzzB/FepE family)